MITSVFFECHVWRRKRKIHLCGMFWLRILLFLSLAQVKKMLVSGLVWVFLVVVVIITTTTKVHMLGKGRLKRYLFIRYLKQKFMKGQTKPPSDRNCSAAWHRIVIMLFLAETVSSLQCQCWALARILKLLCVDFVLWG